jgi:4-amino-4-deoxy-L-arabinose transferase-like glycosyltransferase
MSFPVPPPTRLRHAAPNLLAAAFCLLFLLEGLAFIPYVGLQNDEAIFAGTIYPPPGLFQSMRIFGHTRFPTMVTSYAGTLKDCLYRGIFGLFEPSVWSTRIPMLLAGAATLWMLFVLVRHLAGPRAALAATALLATDASFVLTNCLDWGPVALQHLLLLCGLLLLLRFHGSGRVRFLAAAFFLFGLALWDKAVFSWTLAGLVAGAALIFPRALRLRLTRRNLAVAVVSLLIGAAPLVSFNIKRRLETFRGNARFSSEDVGGKATVLWRTLAGGSLFGYLVRNEPPPVHAPSGNEMEALSVRLSEAFGQTQAGLLPFACILALALLPWLWPTPARKPMLFALIFMVVVWLQMAFTKGAGEGAHHVVLLWPFPHLFAGVALAEASRRLGRAALPALAAALIAVCGSGLVVLNQYLAQLVQNGPTTVWTDAIDPLSAYLRASPARRMVAVDWGVINPLRILDRGRLPLEQASAEIPADAVFISHTPGNEVLPGGSAHMDALAQLAGRRPEVLAVINDRHHRPIFQVYRYVQAHN